MGWDGMGRENNELNFYQDDSTPPPPPSPPLPPPPPATFQELKGGVKERECSKWKREQWTYMHRPNTDSSLPNKILP